MMPEGQRAYPRRAYWRRVSLENATDDGAVGEHIEVKTGDPAEGGLVSGRSTPSKGPTRRESSDTAEAAESQANGLSDGDSVHRLVMDLCKAAAAGHDFDLGQIQIFFAR
jgi:hypothetical protein